MSWPGSESSTAATVLVQLLRAVAWMLGLFTVAVVGLWIVFMFGRC